MTSKFTQWHYDRMNRNTIEYRPIPPIQPRIYAWVQQCRKWRRSQKRRKGSSSLPSQLTVLRSLFTGINNFLPSWAPAYIEVERTNYWPPKSFKNKKKNLLCNVNSSEFKNPKLNLWIKSCDTMFLFLFLVFFFNELWRHDWERGK